MSLFTKINLNILIGFIIFSLTGNSAFARISSKGSEISKTINLSHKYGEVNVEIHGFEQDRNFIAKAEKIIKADVPKLFDYFGYVPQSTMYYEVESDIHMANGATTAFPHNKIILYNYPPGDDGLLLASDEWLRTLIVHETVHTIHMDYTTGWIQGIRNVFGSIAKLNGITPRWFSEGIAVWAETEFTKGGRNRYILNDWALDKYMSSAGACSDVSCISEVSTYPYMGMAYLMGGKFMEYMENQKKGTIACLVRENSNNFPGFLDSAFIDCTGMGIVNHYNQFLLSYQAKLNDRARTFRFTPLAKASNRMDFKGKGEVSLDKGHQLINGSLFFGTYYDRAEYMNTLNIKSGELSSFHVFNKLDFIPEPTEYSRTTNRYPVAVYEYDGISDQSRYWMIFDGKKLEKISEIEEDSPSQYLFQLDKKNYISLRYERDRWWVYDNDGPIYNLERFRTLVHPFIMKVRGKNHLVYQTVHKDKFAVQILELDTKTRKNLFSSSTPFNLAGHYDSYIFINRPAVNEDKMVVLSLEGRSFVSTIEKVHQIARVRFDEKNTVFIHQRDPSFLYHFRGNGDNFVAFLRSRSIPFKSPKFLVADTSEEKISNKQGYKGSPLIRNFKPGYWLLTGINAGEMKRTSLTTMLVDPLNNHTLLMELAHYAKENDFGGNLIYEYQFVKNHYLGGQFWQHYGYSEYRDKVYREDEYELYLRSEWEFDGHYLPTKFSIREERDANILKDKIETTRTGSANLGWVILPKYADSFFNLTQLQLVGEKTNGVQVNYMSAKGVLDTKLYFHPRFEVKAQGMWGRNYKNELVDGLLELDQRFGTISQGDIFGNKLNYQNVRLDLTGHYIYKGWGNKPIFFKELHYVGGIERVEADYIYTKNKFAYDEEYYNAYYGAVADVQLFYMMDTKLVLLFGHILNNGDRGIQFNFTSGW